MNILTAQMKKDLVPLRGLLLAMGGILVLTILSRILDATGSTGLTGNPAAGLQSLLIAVLIVRIIHLDPLTETGAFWRTRPISRAQLLSAKAAFLVLPILALIALSRPSSAAETFETFFPILATAAAFASVTGKFSETIFLGLKMLIIVALVTMLLGLVGALCLHILEILHILPSPALLTPYGVFNLKLGMAGSTFTLMVNILTFASFLAVVVHQYLTLHTRQSVRIIFAILLASTISSSLAEKMAG